VSLSKEEEGEEGFSISDIKLIGFPLLSNMQNYTDDEEDND